MFDKGGGYDRIYKNKRGIMKREQMIIFRTIFLLILIVTMFFPIVSFGAENLSISISVIDLFKIISKFTDVKIEFVLFLFCYIALLIFGIVSLLCEILRYKNRNVQIFCGVCNIVIVCILFVFLGIFSYENVENQARVLWGLYIIFFLIITNIIMYFKESSNLNNNNNQKQ